MKQIINQKYRTVMCDPPWDINQKGKRGAARHYPLMTLDQIKAMPVADLCEENAHLYLWVPNGCCRRVWRSSRSGASLTAAHYTGLSRACFLEILSEMRLRLACSPPADAHRSSSMPSLIGSLPRSRITPTSRRNSSLLLSASHTGHIWSCLPADDSPAGTHGATRSTAISSSPATRCRATATRYRKAEKLPRRKPVKNRRRGCDGWNTEACSAGFWRPPRCWRSPLSSSVWRPVSSARSGRCWSYRPSSPLPPSSSTASGSTSGI